MRIQASLIRRGVVALAALAALIALSTASVLAAGNGSITYTHTDKNAVQSMPSNNPCSGVPGTVTLTYNDVIHYTINNAGDFWITGNQEGAFQFVPVDPGQPTYTGHFHTWFGSSENHQNNVDHFTFQVIGTGSDGSTLNFHETAHISTNASGDITVAFDKPVCG